ncbi:hypothetical protein HYPSUDRAFT_45214 [Hypholoma sublateritium FD-334 SS-4]|uniref:Uncharacterized protein n=1 Tax=Hypholoma sublateritium (strain FD-334 SS-4) TaxID=945553 RepID=A0A0D2KUY4_HYPSF|nr:hypothetical protein HYPSUDRAFT_45214 [Hypholoma sublateritium FD-334 SS-4]
MRVDLELELVGCATGGGGGGGGEVRSTTARTVAGDTPGVAGTASAVCASRARDNVDDGTTSACRTAVGVEIGERSPVNARTNFTTPGAAPVSRACASVRASAPWSATGHARKTCPVARTNSSERCSPGGTCLEHPRWGCADVRDTAASFPSPPTSPARSLLRHRPQYCPPSSSAWYNCPAAAAHLMCSCSPSGASCPARMRSRLLLAFLVGTWWART